MTPLPHENVRGRDSRKKVQTRERKASALYSAPKLRTQLTSAMSKVTRQKTPPVPDGKDPAPSRAGVRDGFLQTLLPPDEFEFT